ncbi:unnamed protein product [Closterium sp. Yama58-4]|nr:unnamed protein product [Closterium sp. Yama58-4]
MKGFEWCIPRASLQNPPGTMWPDCYAASSPPLPLPLFPTTSFRAMNIPLLPALCPPLRLLVHGRGADVSVEGFTKGYTHVFITTFDDAAGRDAYVEHPEHKAYAGVLFQGLEDGIVLDYVPSVVLSRFYS